MIETVIYTLIQICLIVLVVYVVFWVVSTLGLALPPQVINIIWLIVGLVVLLLILRILLPAIGGRGLLGRAALQLVGAA